VPVGEDQVPHVEITREIVRRFNTHFGLNVSDELFAQRNWNSRKAIWKDLAVPALEPPSEITGELLGYLSAALRKRVAEIGFENALESAKVAKKFLKLKRVLVEPGHLLTETPRLPGTDGRRMAKSYGNAIWLSDPPEDIRKKVRNMMTDPQRQRRTDPGRPEVCPVFAWHKLFSPTETIAWSEQGCRTAGIGCIECKAAMADHLVKWIEPIQARRRELEARPEEVWSILDAGSKKAQKVARRTMKRVRNAIFRWDEARKERSFGGPATKASASG